MARLVWLTCLLLTACACGGSTLGAAEQVDGDQVDLWCNQDGAPLRIRVPRDAVVQAYLCEPDGSRCTGIDHVLDGDMVELRCAANPGRPRRVRWIAPVR